MAASPINLSAGLVPAAPPPSAPGGGIDLSAGMVQAAPVAASAPAPAAPVAPATPASAWQRFKQTISDNVERNFNAPSTDIPVVSELNDAGRGIAKGGMQTIGGLLKLGARVAGELGATNTGDRLLYQAQNPGASQQDVDGAMNAQGTKRLADLNQTAKWFTDHADTHGFWEGLGSAGESVAELLGGEGLFKLASGAEVAADSGKVLSIGDKLKQTEKVATFLQNNPRIAKLMALGMRTAHAGAIAGGQAGAQTFVKSGGDAGETAEAALLGGIGGGVIHAGMEGAAGLVRHLAPELVNVAGEEVPVLRSQASGVRPDGTPVRPSALQDIAANTSNSPEVVGQQQAGAMRSVRQEAQSVLSRELEGQPGAASAEAAEGQPGGASAEAAEGQPGGASAEAAEPAAAAGGSTPPTGRVSDPGPVQAGATDLPGLESGPTDVTGTPIAGRLTDGESGLAVRPEYSVEDQSLPGLGAGEGDAALAEPGRASSENAAGGSADSSRGGVEDTSRPGLGGKPTAQIGGGAPGRYKLQPIDAKAAIAATNDFGDAADHLHNAGRQVYDRLNEVTKGQWQAADQNIQKLQSKFQRSVGAERDQVGGELARANRQMEKLFNHPDTGISPTDLAAAKRMWHSGYMLRDLHNALEPAYQVDADFAKRTGQYRGFNGDAALKRFRGQLRTNPELKGLLGTQSTDNLQQIFRYNVTMAGRKRFGEGVTHVAQWVANHGGLGIVGLGAGAAFGGGEGAFAGGAGAEAVYQVTKRVLHRVATDPKVGSNLLYAIEGGARPENYAPLIARMILKNGPRYALPVAAGAVARN